MAEAKKKLQDLVTKEESPEWRKQVEFRKKNKSWLKKSTKIAIHLTRCLRARGITQKELAAKLDVTPQMVNKILKGRENLTLETITNLEEALGIEIVSILKSDVIIADASYKNFVMTPGLVISKVYNPKSGAIYHEVVSNQGSGEESLYATAI